MPDTIVAHKNTVRRWIDKIVEGTEDKIGVRHVKEAALTLRQGGEAAVIGGLLGAVASQSKTGLDIAGVPVDAVAAAGGLSAALYFAREEYADDLRNVGSHSLAIFSYRKTLELLTAKSSKVGLDDDDDSDDSDSDVGEEDPIVTAAREL